MSLIEQFRLLIPQRSSRSGYFDEGDVVLITYGDIVQIEGDNPLATLNQFLCQNIKGLINTVHILPFFPYSSDDGFAVIDYLAVNHDLGTWADIDRLGSDFRLMFDAVINHISQQSDWFQAYLRDEAPYNEYFIEVDPATDLTAVFRPRALPLLTQVDTTSGHKHVWTTFSADQIDLNFASPNLLLEILGVLLNYVAYGAELIRLDAIAYMWKEVGTSCIHLPQTHALIQLMRAVLDEVAPHVALITETNVPHADNINYFGNGRNEAQMVYNFSLPPLTLHTFQTGNAEILTKWARTLTLPSTETTFFNFLASHDGVGVTPARGLLSDAEVQAMVSRAEALGGYVSYKTNSDGSKSAYELNINFLDALGDPGKPGEDTELVARRFIASQAIMLALRGVPGIYFHSLFGSRNWRDGVQMTGRYRTINREKLQREVLQSDLADQDSLRYQVFSQYRQLLKIRSTEPAFHPNGEQIVLDVDPAIFALRRTSPDGQSTVFCLQHVSSEVRRVKLPAGVPQVRNLVNGEILNSNMIDVGSYDVLWIKPIEP